MSVVDKIGHGKCSRGHFQQGLRSKKDKTKKENVPYPGVMKRYENYLVTYLFNPEYKTANN